MSDRPAQRVYKDYSGERYADYEEYYNSGVWPSVGSDGELQSTYVYDMAPQHCASAIHKMRRWVGTLWATDLDVERQWVQVQRTQLYKMLAAKATGIEDFAEALQPSHGLSDARAVHLLARILFQHVEEHQDPVEVVRTAQAIVAGLYKKGYVILQNRT